jgi:hypothetical protein
VAPGNTIKVVYFPVEFSEDALSVLGEQTAIELLLAILLENAMKYTHPCGAVTLSADVVGSSRGSDWHWQTGSRNAMAL